MSTITKDLGIATAYGYAKSKGYTGTEEEFAQLMADYASVGQSAAASAAAAAQSEANAQGAAEQAAQDAAAIAASSAQIETNKDNIEALQGAIETKAEIDGTYESMTVGNAEQLLSTVMTEDKAPYNFRTTGGAADVGNRAYDTLVGGTLVWNQLVGGATASVAIPVGRKFISCINGAWTAGESSGTALSVTGGRDMVFDLSRMFGTAIADYVYSLEQATQGAGAAWFCRLFTKSYYAYNPGELMSVQAASHDAVGFNQFNKNNIASLLGTSAQLAHLLCMPMASGLYISPASQTRNTVRLERPLGRMRDSKWGTRMCLLKLA